jgi:hypothetical protein
MQRPKTVGKIPENGISSKFIPDAANLLKTRLCRRYEFVSGLPMIRQDPDLGCVSFS